MLQIKMKLVGKSFMQMSSGFHHTRAGFVPFWVRNQVFPRNQRNPDFSKLQGKLKLVQKIKEFDKLGIKLQCFKCGEGTTFS